VKEVQDVNVESVPVLVNIQSNIPPASVSVKVFEKCEGCTLFGK
jgi:hypothetical protein